MTKSQVSHITDVFDPDFANATGLKIVNDELARRTKGIYLPSRHERRSYLDYLDLFRLF